MENLSEVEGAMRGKTFEWSLDYIQLIVGGSPCRIFSIRWKNGKGHVPLVSDGT